MSTFNKVTDELVQELKSVLGEKGVTVDPEKLDVYKTDEEGNSYWFHTPEVVVFPETTEQVAEVVKLANKYLVPITPRAAIPRADYAPRSRLRRRLRRHPRPRRHGHGAGPHGQNPEN